MGNVTSASACINDESADEVPEYLITDMLDDICVEKLAYKETLADQLDRFYARRTRDRLRKARKRLSIPGLYPLKSFLWSRVIQPLKHPRMYRGENPLALDATVFFGQTEAAIELFKAIRPDIEKLSTSNDAFADTMVYLCEHVRHVEKVQHHFHWLANERNRAVVVINLATLRGTLHALPAEEKQDITRTLDAMYQHPNTCTIVLAAGASALADFVRTDIPHTALGQALQNRASEVQPHLLPPTLPQRLELLDHVVAHYCTEESPIRDHVYTELGNRTKLVSIMRDAAWHCLADLKRTYWLALQELFSDRDLGDNMRFHSDGHVTQDNFLRYLRKHVRQLQLRTPRALKMLSQCLNRDVVGVDTASYPDDVVSLQKQLPGYATARPHLHERKPSPPGAPSQSDTQGDHANGSRDSPSTLDVERRSDTAEDSEMVTGEAHVAASLPTPPPGRRTPYIEQVAHYMNPPGNSTPMHVQRPADVHRPVDIKTPQDRAPPDVSPDQ